MLDVHDADFLDTASNLRVLDTPERNLYCDEIERVIHDAIRRLPDELRTAVMLREFDGLSYDEIAHVMDCPVGTVRSRIFPGQRSDRQGNRTAAQARLTISGSKYVRTMIVIIRFFIASSGELER